MPTLQELVKERGEEAKQALDVRAAAEAGGRALSAEERKLVIRSIARCKDLTELIEIEAQLDGVRRDAFTTAREPIDRPSGDETRSGATRSLGGDRFRSLGEQLCAVADYKRGVRTDSRLFEQRALGASELVSSDGSFLVQPEFVTQVFTRVYETGQVVSRCDKMTIGAQFNSAKIPAINESSRVDGSRWGGVLAYWAGEGQSFTASRPKFRMMDLVLKKLTALAYATDELLQDSQLLEGIIMKAMTEEIAFQLDAGAIRGIGGGQMLGILNSPALVSVSAASGSGARLLSADVLSIYQHMWAPSRARAVWFINQDVETQLYSMTLGTATVNQAVYIPPGGLSGAPYATLMGRPVIPIEQCSTMGTVGDIIFADMGEYALADKGGIQAATSMHVQFLTDEMVFRFVYRVDGQPKWQLPLTPYLGSNTLSAWVVVATRT